MVSIPERCTNNSPMIPNPYVSTKETIARKSLRLFSDQLYVKHNISVRRLSASKAKHKVIKTGNVLW